MAMKHSSHLDADAVEVVIAVAAALVALHEGEAGELLSGAKRLRVRTLRWQRLLRTRRQTPLCRCKSITYSLEHLVQNHIQTLTKQIEAQLQLDTIAHQSNL